MITLNVDYSEYILIIQSIVAQRNFAKKMLRGENKKSPIYFLCSSDNIVILYLFAFLHSGLHSSLNVH